MAENNSSGHIESLASTKKKSKEKLRVNQLIPSEILQDARGGSGAGIETLLNKYYEFMNISEFIYTDIETHDDVILDDKAAFRIRDPKGENNEFYSDYDGTASSLKIINPNGFIPPAFTFDGTSADIVDATNDTILLTKDQQEGMPLGIAVKYNTSNPTSSIGLINSNVYYVAFSGANKIKLSASSDLSTTVSLNVAGNPGTHSFIGISDSIDYTINSSNITISNGNELPGSLSKRNITTPIGQTLTIDGLGAFNGMTARLTTEITNWNGPGPSYTLNRIEDAMDIDRNSNSELDATHDYLEMMQKEIAASIPSKLNTTVHRNTLYKRIIDFYKLRGSSESIETFFRLLFDEEVVVENPFDNTLIPSHGDWQQGTNQFISNKGFISDKNIKIHDGDRYQKFSYLIKSGLNITDWENTFKKLVHPAGFKLFGEIGILLEMTRGQIGGDANIYAASKEMKNTFLNAFFNHEPPEFQGRPAIQPEGSEHRNDTVLDYTVIPNPGQDPKNVLVAYDSWKNSNYTESADSFRKLYSSMAGIQPGLTADDVPLLVEMMAYVFGPQSEAQIARGALLSPNIGIDSTNTATYQKVHSISIAQAGSGYDPDNPPTITITSNTGDGNAAATAVVNKLGEIVDVVIDNTGANYRDAACTVPDPIIDGVNASGKISTAILSPLAGKKYSKKPILRIDDPTATDSDGVLLDTNVTATAEINIKPTGVDHITIKNNAYSFTSVPTITASMPEENYEGDPEIVETFEDAGDFDVSYKRRISNDGYDISGQWTNYNVSSPNSTWSFVYLDDSNNEVVDGDATWSERRRVLKGVGSSSATSNEYAYKALQLYQDDYVETFRNNAIRIKITSKLDQSTVDTVAATTKGLNLGATSAGQLVLRPTTNEIFHHLHGYTTGTRVVVTNHSEVDFPGLPVNSEFYVHRVDLNKFKLYTTAEGAKDGGTKDLFTFTEADRVNYTGQMTLIVPAHQRGGIRYFNNLESNNSISSSFSSNTSIIHYTDKMSDTVITVPSSIFDWTGYEDKPSIGPDLLGISVEPNSTIYIDNIEIQRESDPAVLKAELDSNGRLETIKVKKPGSGYTDNPTITISGGGITEANQLPVAEAFLRPCEITGITITNRGNGYLFNPRIHLETMMNTEARASNLIKKIILANLSDENIRVDGSGIRVDESNNYYKLKKEDYYDSAKRFNFNSPIEHFSDQTIDSNHINTINKLNTSSFISSISGSDPYTFEDHKVGSTP